MRVENIHSLERKEAIVSFFLYRLNSQYFIIYETEINCKKPGKEKWSPKSRKNLMSLAAMTGHTNFIPRDQSERLQRSAGSWR